MLDSRSDRAVRSIVIHVASFAYAMGFFISTKKFLDFPATDPIAVGRVTVEAASKLQDYVRFGYFILIVPLLTLLLIHWLPRIGRRVVRSIPRQTPLSIVAFASLPLAISPFLYLTTYKEVWSVLLPPLLAWLVLAGWIAFARFEWLRSILSAGDRETHALVVTEGLALILFRYIATGSRIAHIPSLLLETIFLLFFLALWWVTVLALALLIARTPDELEPAWRRVAAGCFPLMLLPVASILPVQPLAAFAAALLVTVLGIALFLLAKISLTRATIAAMTAWIAAPLVIFVLSYASSAHTTGWVDLFHQGETLGPASDYLQGKVPYEGVFPLHGLLQDGLLDAWLMEFLGRSADVAIQRSTVLEALMLPAIWILSWVAFRSWSASAASVLAAIVLAADNQRAVLLIVVATLFLAAIRSGRNWILFAAGILSAATLFFSLEIGIYCFVGGIALLLALPALEPSARALKGSVKSAGYFSAGMAAGAAPFLLYLSASGVTHECFQTTFVTIPSLIDATWSLPFPDLDDWFSKSLPGESLFDLAWHVRFGINGLVLGLAIIVLAWRALTRSVTLDDRILLALTIFGLVSQRSALGRADFFHQWFSAFMISPILVALVWRGVRAAMRQTSAVKIAIVMTAVALIPVGLTISWAPSLLEENLDETIEYRARRSGTAPDPAGEMSTRRIDRVAAEIRARSDSDDPILDFSNQPAFYFFANRRNPTRFYQVPLMSPIGHQEEVIRDLQSDPPAVVIMSSPDAFDRFDTITNRDRALLVSSWIEHHYSPAVRVEGVDLWVPSADQPSVWSPPENLPSPSEVALRPDGDGRIVFPSVGTVSGADRARWSSDLHLYNPNSVPIGLRLRFVTRDEIREHRFSILPGRSEKLPSVAESFFGMPQKLGALWIIYDRTFPPIARVVTRRVPGTTRGIHAAPLTEAEIADADTDRSSLLISGFEPGNDERINLSIVNFAPGMTRVKVRAVNAGGETVGQAYTTRIAEEHSFVVVDVVGHLEASGAKAGAITIDVVEGRAGAQLSIVDPQSGSADVIPAVPVSSHESDRSP